MTTLATITAVLAVFAVVQVQEWRQLIRSNRYADKMGRHPQEWRQLTRNNRYAVKLKHHNDVMLSKARANIRLAECASVAKHERRKVGVA